MTSWVSEYGNLLHWWFPLGVPLRSKKVPSKTQHPEQLPAFTFRRAECFLPSASPRVAPLLGATESISQLLGPFVPTCVPNTRNPGPDWHGPCRFGRVRCGPSHSARRREAELLSSSRMLRTPRLAASWQMRGSFGKFLGSA